MGVYGGSLANRRMIMLAVLSLIASLLTAGFNAPAARATGETFTFGSATYTVGEGAGSILVPVTLTANEALLVQTSSIDVSLGAGTTAGAGDYGFAPVTLTWPINTAPGTENVTVTINDDFFDDEGEIVELQLSNEILGGSPITIATTQITITDDDPPATIEIEDLAFSEAVGTATFTVNRTGTTEADVDFTYTTINGSAVAPGDFTAVTAAPATITAGTGGSTTVTVPIINDLFDETDETFTISLAVTSGNAGVTGGTGLATIQDNDAGATIEIEDLAFSEAVGTATFTVNRTGTTEADVDFTYTTINGSAVAPGDFTAVTAAPATITAGTGGSTTVTVPIINDLFDETDETFTISLAVTSGNAGVTGGTGLATIQDNDAGATIEIEDLAFSEAVGTATFTVNRTGTTEADVDFTYTTINGSAVAPGDFTAVTAAPATITAGTGGSTTVTVPIINDLFDETDETFTISLAVTSGNAGVTGGTGLATIQDNDAGATIEIEDLAFSEAVGTATFTVNRTGTTEADVDFTYTTINGSAVAPGDFTAVTAAPATITAGTGGSTTVTVPIINDLFDETDETFTISLAVTSGNAGVTGGTGLATIQDNDTKGVTINELGGVSVNEAGGTDTYTVVLNSEPTADVTITIAATGSEATATSPLVFTAGPTGNWDQAQTVTVAAVNDAIDDGNLTETFTHTAVGGDYAGIGIADVIAATIDDDTKGVTIDEAGGVSVEEGGLTDTYTVVLNSEPTADVTITIAATGSEATATSPLVFTAGPTGNWDQAQTVTVTAVNDAIDDGNLTETFTHTAVGGDYAGIGIADVIAATIDDDTKGVTLTPTTVPVTEGATGEYDVVLDSEPTADVTITVTGDAQATALPGTLTFTAGPAGNWDLPQTVTITAVDDMVAEAQPHTGTISHTAVGGDYAGLTIGDVTVEITDNDSAGVDIDTDDGVSVTEALGAGHTDTYRIRLTTQPTANVIITINDLSPEYSRAPATLTFTGGPTGNWGVFQTVTVTGTDDDIDDGDTNPSITHTAASGDGNYSGIGIGSVSVSVIDDDAVGVTVSQAAATVVEGGVADTYTVVLDSEPTSNVVITLATTTGEAKVDKPTLTFTPANWDSLQTVSITANDDDVIDGETTDTITHVAAGGGYTGVAIGSIAATVSDNDVAGVTIVESDDSTDVIEGADTDTYTAVLDAEPGSNVVISISTDGQTTVAPSVLTFTAANWDMPQTVTVSGVEDGIDEIPSHPGVIQHTAAGDPDFVGITIDDVVANVGDADALLVTIDGPNFGAPGKTSVFTAMVNAGGTGAITYEWTVFFGGNPIASGDQANFSFTPSEGGAYIVRSLVGDTQGQNPAEFIQFKVLGDIGGSTFVEDIIWMAEEGITFGCNPPANDEFCPAKTVTRGQMAAFLVRFLGLTAIDSSISFTDTGSSVFEQDILKLATAGITRGCNADGTQFCPNKGVTRGQMAAFLVRAFGLTDNGGGDLFTDDDTSIFENDIDKLATAGITRGCNPPTNDNFCPTKTVTRGQMSAFLHRAEGLLSS